MLVHKDGGLGGRGGLGGGGQVGCVRRSEAFVKIQFFFWGGGGRGGVRWWGSG